jgi:transposase
MSTRFVSVDRNQPLLLPVDLRDWVPEDDLVHFVIEAVDSLPSGRFRFNVRGSGSAQYPPSMMLALLIYCYANGIFSSRRIERATHRDIAVRYLTGDTHPDHDTIATFRRENFEVVAACFVRVLELAREMKLLKVGTVSVDGTKLKANASKNRNVRYDRAGELVDQLSEEVRELLEQAERTDRQDEADGQRIPEEIARRNDLKSKLEAARKRIEARAKAKAESERADYERKVEERDARQGSAKGCHIKPPDETPREEEQENLTDPDSRLMRKSKRSGYEQAYNAQAAVDADGSQLVLSARISQCASDRNELAVTVNAIPHEAGTPSTVLADNGYLHETQVRALEGDGPIAAMEVLVSVHAEAKQLRRKHDFRPLPTETKEPPQIRSAFVLEMKAKMERDESRKKYKLRKQTVEPVFGTIKKWMGFTQFHLRGLEKVDGEWKLLTLAYNVKRLWKMEQGPAPRKKPANSAVRAQELQSMLQTFLRSSTAPFYFTLAPHRLGTTVAW